MTRFAVLGGGNMGRALLAGILGSKVASPSGIVVADPKPETRKKLAKDFRVATESDNRAAVRGAHVILLCMKPQQMAGVLDELKGVAGSRQLVLSVAAGIKTAFIESRLGKGIPVIRSMPNTPALFGAGAVVFSPGRFVKPLHDRMARRIFSAVGKVWTLPEKHLDAVTALSGSGPAYVFLVAEAMIRAGVRQGLPGPVAEELARQTIFGSGLMLKGSPESPSVLRERVTSPGGTTAAALAVFQREGLPRIFERALSAARRRSRELSQRVN